MRNLEEDLRDRERQMQFYQSEQNRMMHTEVNIPAFVRRHSVQFSVEDTIDFFERLGIYLYRQERLALSEKQSGEVCWRCTVYGGCQSGCENQRQRTGYRNPGQMNRFPEIQTKGWTMMQMH